MKLFMLRWVSNIIALKLTDICISGIWFQDWQSWLLTGLVLGLLNAFVRPVLLFLTLPLNILTLGVFTIFLNAAIFFTAGYIIPGFVIRNYPWAILGSLLFSVFSTALSWVFQERREFKVPFHLWRY